jgi:hypothetical protein
MDKETRRVEVDKAFDSLLKKTPKKQAGSCGQFLPAVLSSIKQQ